MHIYIYIYISRLITKIRKKIEKKFFIEKIVKIVIIKKEENF